MQYNVFARMVTLGVVILPVIRGDLIRPQFIFPAIPLIKLFIGSVVLRMVMDQVYRLSEMFVAARRIEVYIHVVMSTEVENIPISILALKMDNLPFPMLF